MIGNHEDCPVSIFAVYYTFGGDESGGNTTAVSGLFANFEAAETYYESRRGYGPQHIFEFHLGDNGQYERGLQWWRDCSTGEIRKTKWDSF